MAASRVVASFVAFTLLAACGGGEQAAPRIPTVAANVSGAPGSGLLVGAAVASPLRIRVTDASGRAVPGTAVTWAATGGGSVVATTQATDNQGVAEARWTLGTGAGEQSATATAAGLPPVVFTTTAGPESPATLRIAGDSVLFATVGDSVRPRIDVVDRYGNVIPAPTVQWTSSNAGVAVVSPSGVVSALRGGVAVVTVTSGGVSTTFQVNVLQPVVRITGVSADTLRPGATFSIDGDGFDARTLVSVAGAPAAVSAVTPTRLTVVTPSRSALPCQADGPAPVVVTLPAASGVTGATATATREVPIVVALPRTLAVGQSLTVLDAESLRCTRLPASGGRYVVTVFNTSTAPASTSAFQLRGIGGIAPSGLFADVQGATRTIAPTRRVAASERLAAEHEAQHAAFLEEQRATVTRLGSPLPALRAARAQRTSPAGRSLSVGGADGSATTLGDTVTMRTTFSTCSRFAEVRARVAYVGTRSIVLEDVTAAQAGQMDEQYRLIGKEFDEVQYPILEKNFGNPLAMDAQLDNNGRVVMLFTRFINDSLPGIAGFVISCDFYPRSIAPASNVGEVFYARVADAAESPVSWRRGMRSTIIHEVKHITAYAERLRRGAFLEQSWLEESTARVSEELYSRTFSNVTWKSNAPYSTSVGCERTGCDDRPIMMRKHFEALASYYANTETFTPMGAARGGDFSFYASGWSLVRWAADHYASDEGAFLRELVGGGATGIENLAARTGRSSSEMLADWSLAMALDDYPGFTASRTQLSMPSWNTRDVFRGLNTANPSAYPFAFPLFRHVSSFGDFAHDVPQLRAFSAAYFEISGTPRGSQLVELRSLSGGPPSPSLRIAIVRIE
jgi:hypothetical protein